MKLDMKLKIGGEVVIEGQTITDFRGEAWKFLTLVEDGRKVFAERGGVRRVFYPSVFKGEVTE